ncbi:hypothetical protein K501DRAFT_286806 [Backusella circina FSU 941]|nr:hypothetical protein K501DRAFT_289625 [Backusella circina FSU 941]KAI8880572.1 hypothetical protein K501DRAFT_286806 [Backusella circina FSU 941]
MNGFNIIFHLTSLRYDNIQIMQETGRLAFPRSLKERSSFVNLKTICNSLKVTEVFWRLYKLVNHEEPWRSMCRPTHPIIYPLIHTSKNRHRFRSLEFNF